MVACRFEDVGSATSRDFVHGWHCAELKIVKIPKEVQWEIEKSSGGTEPVSEAHRQWN